MVHMDTNALNALYAAAIAGDADAIAKLEKEADRSDHNKETILHKECRNGNTERVRFILREFAHKHLLVKLNQYQETALHKACYGSAEVVEVLIDSARRNLPSSLEANDNFPCNQLISSFEAFVRHVDRYGNTALHVAVMTEKVAIVKLLVEADPSDRHIINYEDRTPIYIAVEKGYKDIVKVICTTCTAPCFDGPYGTTALHAAIKKMEQAEEKDRDVVIELINSAAKLWSSSEDEPNHGFEVLFVKTDSFRKTVLDMAVQGNYRDLVGLIIHIGWASKSRLSLLKRLIDIVADRGYNDILKVLSETYEARISPAHKGLIALFFAIRGRDKESVLHMLGDAKHLAKCADHEGWTPLHVAAYHEFDSVLDAIIRAQNDVGFQYVYELISTPLHVAAERGYTSTVIRLAQLWPYSRSYVAVNKEGRNILHLAAFQSKKEMIQAILKYCPEEYKDKIVNEQDRDGNTPLHLLVSNGCFIPELLKYKGLNTKAKNKRNWTPRDMLYFQDQIIADQAQIKIALDDIQTSKYWKFWRKSVEKRTDILESIVLPSKREAKDALFRNAKKLLMDEKHARMKKELERYKKRTNTQIIVTALITTVAFTVGFTMPSGLHQSGEKDEGLVVLSKKTAFNAFMVSDALALLLSTCSLFLYFLESIYEDHHQVSKLNAASTGLNIVSVMAMMLTFITGTYVVLSHSRALAITVCLIGSLFFLFVIVLLIKIVYDRQVKRNED